MKMLSKLALLAALVIAPASVQAQVSVDAGAAGSATGAVTGSAGDSGAAAGANAGLDASATGSVSTGGDEENYGSLISSLNANGTASVNLSSFTDQSEVRIVFVSSLQGEAGANAQALDEALQKNASAMASLHASIEANAALKAKLDSQNVEVENVVAVNSSTDGSLTIFVDDREG